METPGLAGFENYKLPTGFPISAYDTPSVLVGKQFHNNAFLLVLWKVFVSSRINKTSPQISPGWMTLNFSSKKGLLEMFARFWFQSVWKIFNQERTLGEASMFLNQHHWGRMLLSKCGPSLHFGVMMGWFKWIYWWKIPTFLVQVCSMNPTWLHICLSPK